MHPLSIRDVARARQRSLLLAGPALASASASASAAEDVVTWFGAMQAQDAASGSWSLGVRVPGATRDDIDGAFEGRGILRTWPMRGTIHIVPARDTGWLLELTGVRALDASATRRGQLGISVVSAERAVSVLEGELASGRRLTRAQALAALEQRGLDTAGQRGYYFLWYAAHVGAICIGPMLGKEQTFVLLREWAPEQRSLTRTEALVEIALRYFRSHGPATMKDFAGWTGLTLTDARAAVAGNEGRLVPALTDAGECWLTADLATELREGRGRSRVPAHALPGFDEFMLGFKDRSAQLDADRMDLVVPGGNGMFRATLCLDGRAVGVWTRTIKRTRVDVTSMPFEPLSDIEGAEVEGAFARYGEFLGLPITTS